MAIWLIRAGSIGEYEQKFINEKRVYVTWDKLANNLAKLPNRESLFALMTELYPESKPKCIHNWVSQVWPFAHDINKGDIVVVPLKSQPAVYFGEVTGEYKFESGGPSPFYHWRSVKWIGEGIPRSHFAQDMLYSFGAFMTICRIQRNNAEARINAMRANGWKPETRTPIAGATAESGNGPLEKANLEELAHDQIAELIATKFKGHKLALLVESILIAQGYTTYRSPEGPDGGVDILAGAGPLGFAAPRLCVQVKSQEAPVDRPTVDQLLGVMSKVGAQEGLFVSWSGFRSNVQRELVTSFFKVRLWSQKELLENLFAHYDQLDEDLKAELPLKRIWTVTVQEEE